MRAKQRDVIARLIFKYLIDSNVDSANIIARDIAEYYHLPNISSQSISAILHTLSSSDSTKYDFGFAVIERKDFKKRGHPHQFTIKLIRKDYSP